MFKSVVIGGVRETLEVFITKCAFHVSGFLNSSLIIWIKVWSKFLEWLVWLGGPNRLFYSFFGFSSTFFNNFLGCFEWFILKSSWFFFKWHWVIFKDGIEITFSFRCDFWLLLDGDFGDLSEICVNVDDLLVECVELSEIVVTFSTEIKFVNNFEENQLKIEEFFNFFWILRLSWLTCEISLKWLWISTLDSSFSDFKRFVKRLVMLFKHKLHFSTIFFVYLQNYRDERGKRQECIKGEKVSCVFSAENLR